MSKTRITAEDLRQRYYTEPFRPFTIVLDTGARIGIRQRIRFGIAPSGQFMSAAMPDGDFTIVAIKHIAAIEERLPKLRRKTGNGARSRRKAG